MSRELIVTSYGPALEPFGQRCRQSLAKHWPIPFVAYTDEDTEAIPGFVAVRDALPTSHPYAEKPTNYSWNARKYAVKPFVWQDVARSMEPGILIWLDADTEITADIPAGFAASVLNGAKLAYLGRGAMHPETGVVLFRIPEALPLLDWCVDAYRTGSFMAIEHGWTDCHVLKAGIIATDIAARDLTSRKHDGPWRSGVDAVGLSPFAPYLIHHKGGAAKRVVTEGAA